MKRVWLCLALIIASVSGTAVYAADAEYTEGKAKASDVSKSVYTVLIVGENVSNVSAADIYYVDQAADGLNAAAGFALKGNPTEGTYNMILGYNKVREYSAGSDILRFEISSDVPESKIEMKALENGVVYNDAGTEFSKGFVTEEAFDANDYNSLVFAFTNKDGSTTYMGYPLSNITVISGNASVMLGVQLNEIPKEEYDPEEVTLYLSDKIIVNN